MRRVVLRGIVGGLPGMLIALVPLLLHDVGMITSDQSQIGFMGVPLLFIGVFIGTLSGASGHTGSVALGVVLGFVLGLAIGVALVPGLWLFLTPATMIAGGALGAWWAQRRDTEHPPPPTRTPLTPPEHQVPVNNS